MTATIAASLNDNFKGVLLGLLHQVVHADAHHEECRRHQSGSDGMTEQEPRARIEQQGSKIHHLRPSVHDRESHRSLHEAVRHQDPESAQRSAERYQHHHRGMQCL